MLGRTARIDAWCFATLTLIAATPAFCEVMDKELSVPEIWHWAFISSVAAVASAFVHPWLLPPVFLLGPANAVAIAWAEWHDPFVGPAMASEAGPHYGWHADGAMSVMVATYVCVWFLARRFPRLSLAHIVRRLRRREKDTGAVPVARARCDDLRFAVAMLAITVAHAASGFAFRWTILLSLPVLIAAFAVMATWLRFTLLAP